MASIGRRGYQPAPQAGPVELSRAIDAVIARLRHAGYTYRQIADFLHLSHVAVLKRDRKIPEAFRAQALVQLVGPVGPAGARAARA